MRYRCLFVSSAQEAVEAVIGILGMQPCEGSEAVPPNARSHTALLAGICVGYQQVRLVAGWMCGHVRARQERGRGEGSVALGWLHALRCG